MAQSANFGLWELDYITGEFYWNEGMEKLFGRKINSGQGYRDLWREVLSPDEYDALVAQFSRQQKAGEDFYGEHRITIYGQVKYVKTFATFKNNAETGLAEMVTGIVLDITDRKKAEISLNKSEQHYRLVADNMAGLVVLLTPSLKRLYVSPSCLALTGYTAEQFMQSSVRDIVHPDDLEALFEILKNCIYSGEGQVTTCYRIRHKNGRWLVVEVLLKAVRDADGNLQNILSTTRDITKQREAEDALRQSEEKYRLLADNIEDMVVLLTPGFKRVYVSPSTYNMLGYTPHELIEESPDLDLFYDEADLVKAQDAAKTMVQGKGDGIAQFAFRHKNGQRLILEGIPKAIWNENGTLKNLLISVRNVTRQVETEQALRKSEEQYKLLADNIVDMVVLLTPNMQRLYVSPSCIGLTGYTPKELLDGPSQPVLFYTKDDREIATNAIAEMVKGEGSGISQFNFKHKNGDKIIVEAIAKAIMDENGNVRNLMVAIRNITRQAEAEQALRNSEVQYRMLADNIADIVVLLLTPDFKRAYVSPSAYALTGYTPLELVDINPMLNIFYSLEDLSIAQAAAKQIIEGIEQVISQYSLRHKNGDKITVEAVIKGIRNTNGGIQNYLLSIRNITLQVKAEKALRASEEKYRMLADNIVDMVLLLTPDHIREYVSPSCFGLVGYTADELLEKQRAITVFNSKEDENIVRGAQNRIIKSGTTETLRYNLRHKNGNRVTVEAIVKGIVDETGRIKNFLLAVRNVTPQVEVEDALRKSELQYRMLADNIIDMVAMYDKDGMRMYVSPSSKYLLGYEPDELMGRDSSDIMDAEDLAMMRENVIEKAQKTGQKEFFISARLRHKLGYWLYVEITIKAILNDEEQLTGFVATTRNVTEQKKDQIALAESEKRYRLLADNIFDMLVLYTTDYKRVYVSPSSIRLTGYTPEEIMAMDALALTHPDDSAGLQACIVQNIQKGNERFIYEFRTLHKTEGVKFVSCTFTVIKNEKGELTNVLATSRDITAKRKAGIALKESEEKYRSLVEASEDIILIMDANGKYLFANEIASKHMNCSVAECIGKTIYDFFDQATGDRYAAKIEQVLDTRQKVTFENPIATDTQKFWLRNTLLPIYDAVANVNAVMLCIVDISDIKAYADTLLMQNRELKQIAYLQSHVVRAPLANIEGIINLLDESSLSEENRQYIYLLKTSALQLDGIIKDIVNKAIEVKQHSAQAYPQQL